MNRRDMTATEVAIATALHAEELRDRAAGLRGGVGMSGSSSRGLYSEGDVTTGGHFPAAGHNPAGLTVAQVGVGYRLLAPEEICKASSRGNPGGHRDIEAWTCGEWDNTGWSGDGKGRTYRTAKPPGFFLPAGAGVSLHPEADVEHRTMRVVEEAADAAGYAAADAKVAGAVIAGTPGAKYVHTFVCRACLRTCTMETVTAASHLSRSPIDMLCPFPTPGYKAMWKAGPVETLTP